jgi:hypothetical protein
MSAMISNLTSLRQQDVADPSNVKLNTLLTEITRYSLALCRKRSICRADAEEIAHDRALNGHRKQAARHQVLRKFRAHFYNDMAGHPTAGCGHMLKPGKSFPDGVTEEQVTGLLRADVGPPNMLWNSM